MNRFTDHMGKEWKFNDCVIALFCFDTEERRSGRLVQVRKGAGQFGTDMYFIRLRDGELRTFENVMLQEYGQELPAGPDSIEQEYTIKDEWPETGFIIEHPKQPISAVQSFSMMIVSPQ